jgi:hypothetical protein
MFRLGHVRPAAPVDTSFRDDAGASRFAANGGRRIVQALARSRREMTELSSLRHA